MSAKRKRGGSSDANTAEATSQPPASAMLHWSDVSGACNGDIIGNVPCGRTNHTLTVVGNQVRKHNPYRFVSKRVCGVGRAQIFLMGGRFTRGGKQVNTAGKKMDVFVIDTLALPQSTSSVSTAST